MAQYSKGYCKTKIPEHVREFVCIRLACFDQPSQVRQLVRENFDLDLSPQSIEHYDPYRYAGKGLARKFVHLFYDARKRYLEDVADVALAQKTHRLKWLERLAAEAERMGDITGAAEIIEKASKDSTDYWTRSHTVRHSGQVATPAEPRQDHIVRIYLPDNGRDPIPEGMLVDDASDGDETE